MFTQTTIKHHHPYSDLKYRGKFQWNRAFFTLSLIIEGATENILQFVLPMKPINNKKFCFDKQKIMSEHCSVRFKQWIIFKITIFQFFLICAVHQKTNSLKKKNISIRSLFISIQFELYRIGSDRTNTAVTQFTFSELPSVLIKLYFQ